jgi:uncharacterized protein (DUF486 family)
VRRLTTLFAFIVFREPSRWNYVISYTLIGGAVYFAFRG